MPEVPSPSPSPLAPYGLGIGLSFVLSLWVTGFALAAIFDTDLTGGEWLALVLMGVLGAGALGLALLIYFALKCRNAPAKALVLMVVPPLLATGVVPAYLAAFRMIGNRVPDTSPTVWETHVNLSGQPFWLAPDVQGVDAMGASPLMPIAPAQATSFSRYVGEAAEALAKFPYADAHLRSNIQTYSYGYGDAQGHATPTLPLVKLPYPDLHELTPYEQESSLLLHQYFHYPDHVEMVPSLPSPSETFEAEMRGKPTHLVSFYLSNRVPPAIARLEIDGQTLGLAQDKKMAISDCSRGNTPVGYALVDLDIPLRLRWQTLDDPMRWHEATVRVPAWRQPLPGKPASLPSVTLYFTGASQVAAERFELLSIAPDERGLIATGMPADVSADQACGSAADYFPDYFKRFQ